MPLLVAIPVIWLLARDDAMRIAIYGEGGYIEWVQVGFWVVCILSATVLVAIHRHRQYRLHTLWLGIIAVVAAARELDLHEALNPETLGDLGVRYRIDWVLDGSVPIWLKAMWAGIFLVIGAALIVPLIFANGLPDFASTRGRLFLIAVAFLGLGFVFDDLLRHVITNDAIKMINEEAAELIGVAFFLAAVLALPPESQQP